MNISSLYQRIAKSSVVISIITLLVIVFSPSVAFAQSDTKTPSVPVFPCGSSPGAVSECHFYQEVDKKLSTVEGTLVMALVMAALNAMTMMTQQLAEATAQFMLHGGKGGFTQYYTKSFSGMLDDVATAAANSFISDMQNYVLMSQHFNICAPVGMQALNLQLSIGIQKKIWPQKPLNCSFQQFLKNIDVSAQTLQNADLFSYVNSGLKISGSDLGASLTFQQQALINESTALNAAVLDRQEGGGLKLLGDAVTGNVKTPAEEVKNDLKATNGIAMNWDSSKLTLQTIGFNAFKIGVYQLPALFGSTLLNTLASSGLEALKKSLFSKGQDNLAKAQLLNPFAQTSAETQKKSLALSDIIMPNLTVSQSQDFVHELSSCPTPRGLWGCAMDDGFAAGLRSYSDSGAFSVARAAGIGTNGKGMVFLHADWELIPESDTKDNQDPGCYLRAYCASNLSKMRFARILPVGWELAANSPYNIKQGGKYITLAEVLRGYNDCSATGQIDATHPWCHLIDPAWTVTAPPFECHLKGFGDAVISGQYPVRMQECSDVVSCLGRNDKGECTGGYGYCLSDKTVWRFDADACEERYTSCRTYQTRNKTQVLGGAVAADAVGGASISLIRNTIDYGSCNSNNVGCTYYATTRDTSTTSTDQWVGSISAPKFALSGVPGVGPMINGGRVYFDASVVPCDASGDGCTKVYSVKPGVSALNLIENGSFENMQAADSTKFVAWHVTATGAVAQASTSAVGATSADVTATGVLSQHVAIAPLRNYVISYYAQRDAGATSPTVEVRVLLQKADGTPVAAGGKYYRNPDTCSPTSTDTKVVKAADNLFGFFQRYTCEFVSNADAAGATIEVAAVQSLVDGVQLEESDAATLFVDGVNTQLDSTDIKLPPEELGCSGSTTDRPECAKFATMCQQSDAGCQGYTDIAATDNTEVPAILSAEDQCPSQCVGYAEYRKLPSAFDLVQDPTHPALNDPKDDTYLAFVPAQSSICSVADVGCEAFTNIESVAQGGETSAAYNYTRQCAKPNTTDDATYFTWEGSDTTGYQLRTWNLVKDQTLSPAPPKTLPKAGPDGTIKGADQCNASSWKLGFDPDCRQFYDDKGNAFYAYYSQTIIASSSCQNYRKDNSDQADCTLTGGTMNEQGECIYPILASESVSCNAAQTGCRAFLGTTGRNTTTVLNPTFMSSSTDPFVAGAGTNITVSGESLMVGGRTLKVSSGSSSAGLSVSVPFTSATSSLYSVSFWAKTTDGTRPTMSILVDGKSIGSPSVGTTWARFEYGPFPASSPSHSSLAFINVPNATYIDRIVVQRLSDVAYARINGLATPSICEQTTAGVPLPRAMLGCKTYQTRAGDQVNVRQFSSLCRYNAIGCSAFVDTRNSVSAYAQSFTLNGIAPPTPGVGKYWDSLYMGDTVVTSTGSVPTSTTQTVTRPADRYVYAVDTPAMHCSESQESCRAFGQPSFNPDLSLASSTPFTTVYLKDDITKYVDNTGEPNMLCRPSELFCDSFTSQISTGAVTSYFRDPGQHLCEWKEKVALPDHSPQYRAGEYSGWFVKDAPTPTPCYPDLISQGNQFLTEFSGSSNYLGWTSTCPDDQSECTEFRDPNDHSDQVHPDGKPYYFINNNRLDKESCNGQVDVLSGCVLFRDTTNSDVNYNTKATYAKSNADNQAPESPINCASDSSNPLCQNGKICTDIKWKCVTDPSTGIMNCPLPAAVPDYIKTKTGASCVTDTDCASKPVFGTTSVFTGTCAQQTLKNDANLILKVRLDRDCATWLGCSAGETVYDSSQSKYVDLCTDLSVCDKSLSSNSGQFCAHYVDRRATSSTNPLVGEQLLKEGVFVNSTLYSQRVSGFGTPDYSGYSLPNHFQVADMQTRRVGYELLENQPGAVRDKYYSDFRVVARKPLCMPESKKQLCVGVDTNCDGFIDEGCPGVSTPQSNPYSAIRYTDPAYPFLNLCQDAVTKQVGYYLGTPDAKDPSVPSDKNPYCYFAIDTPYSQNPSDTSGDLNPRNVQNLYSTFVQNANIDTDPQMMSAFPGPTCKANPDAASPFPNAYVTEWNTIPDPSKPKKFAEGFENVPVCEQGEDCSCSYRKVSYGSITKYYAPNGQTPPSGICSGGTRDGQACIPTDSVTTGSSSASTSTEPQTGMNPQTPTCGTGGTCQSIQTVSLVRGVFGQCLEKDASRPSVTGAAPPCLVWNPTPVLFGDKDAYHYQPTAGYLPPQNAGEYYCVANAQPAKSTPIAATPDSNWFTPPGQSQAFNFDDDSVSDGDCFLCSGNKTNFVDGNSALGGDMGKWCQDAKKYESKGGFVGLNFGHLYDGNAGRWIQTGRGQNRNYAEYFIPINPVKWTEWLTGVTPSAPDSPEAMAALTERNFSYFNFSPIDNPNGRGLMGCGVSPEWVDGVGVDDFSNGDKLTSAWNTWLDGFNKDFSRIMSRESQDYLMAEDGKNLMKVPCTFAKDNTVSGDGGCYIKYWELGYHNDGQTEFQMQNGTPHAFTKDLTYYASSEASKPFFSIRAVFEDGNESDNKQGVEDMSPNKLTGPFRFIGWWVTATSPGQSSERAIYMYLTIGHADICKEVAQVVAPDTRVATPFMDRIWSQSGFAIPGLGYSQDTTNVPYGSAKNTRAIGTDPLFQVHGAMPGALSKLRPPTFISSGVEYARQSISPANNWAWLTNIFARVYRVYRYYDQVVSKDSWACVTGPEFGNWCPDLSNDTTTPPSAHCADGSLCGPSLTCADGKSCISAQALSQKYCGYAGTCTGPSNAAKATGLCNSLSGVNAGLSCSSNTADQVYGYHVCHNAPAQQQADGSLEPQYKPCVSWNDNVKQLPNGKWQLCGSSSCNPAITEAAAAAAGWFNCADGALMIPDPTGFGSRRLTCNKPTAGPSTECPARVMGVAAADVAKDEAAFPNTIISTCDATKHCTNGFQHAQCNDYNDCEFTYAQWWGAQNADKPGYLGTKYVPIDSPGSITGTVNDINVTHGYALEGVKAMIADKHSTAWWTSGGYAGKQTRPGDGDFYDADARALLAKAGGTLDGTKVPLDIGGKDLYNANFVSVDPTNAAQMKRVQRFPGAYAATTWQDAAGHTTALNFIPAHCEIAPTDEKTVQKTILDCVNAGDTSTNCAQNTDKPYASSTYAILSGYSSTPTTFPPGIQRYFGDGGSPWKLATCEGGPMDGKMCSSDQQCTITGTDTLQKMSAGYCRPVAIAGSNAPNNGTVQVVADPGAVASAIVGSFSFSCQAPDGVGDIHSTNLDTDTNVCTHNAGYYPRMDLCGSNPLRSECLTAINARDPISINANNPTAELPTDVTEGLYTPRYLQAKQAAEAGSTTDPTKVPKPTDLPTDDRYMSYYTPRPPTLAAPDTSRECPSTGSCSIAKMNAFTVENQTEGKISFVGGQAVSTIRFYGWAADNQGPIRDILIDWGDGTVQKIQDAQMKNKKPFCGGTKQCQFIPGLTCNVDNDCPAAGGRCLDIGFCKAKPNVSCFVDDDCSSALSIVKDKCQIRQTFGNTPDSCEQNYFEFTHAYSCGSEKRTGTQCDLKAGQCSRNNAVSCLTNKDCGPGDTCLTSLAPPSGCFDSQVTSCRYTPRVLVEDNWGWCTGECRISADTTTGNLIGGLRGLTTGTGGTTYNNVLLPNGGCYDDSKLYQNTNSANPFSAISSKGSVNGSAKNMCDPASTSPYYSPWVVFQGAVQLGITQ